MKDFQSKPNLLRAFRNKKIKINIDLEEQKQINEIDFSVKLFKLTRIFLL